MMWGYGFDWLSMLLMMLGLTLWVVFLVVIGWAVIRWLNQRMTSPTRQTNARPGSSLTALEIVKQRYARGEIDATTFELMRERLEPPDNTHQKSWAEVELHRSAAGEKLFDGRTSGS